MRLTIGSKVEHNDTTGAEIQPSARILWSPTTRQQSVWGAVSRAVRLPFIAEEEVALTFEVVPPFPPENPGVLPVETLFLGNPGIVSEDLPSVEVGYRAQPSDKLSLDATAFYNFYGGLRSFVVGSPFFAPTPVPRVVVPARWEDNDSAETWGAEIAADWEVFSWCRLKAAYTYFHEDLKADSIGRGMSPLHQASLRSMLDVGGGWEFDLWPRYVDNLPA